jgi:hypothetical protein
MEMCPGNKQKKNAVASDWSQGTVGYMPGGTRVKDQNLGVDPLGSADYWLAVGSNVNTAERSSSTGFPKINPFPGFCHCTDDRLARNWKQVEMVHCGTGNTDKPADGVNWSCYQSF